MTILRDRPLLERKRRLLRILPTIESRLLFLDHLHERGRDLFAEACRRDLEGIVAKWAAGRIRPTAAARRGQDQEPGVFADGRARRTLLGSRHS